MATPAQESSAASGAPPHAKFSFAAAAKAVQASNKEANRVKFEKLKESREKAKAKLAAAREVIARCAPVASSRVRPRSHAPLAAAAACRG
jgi:hypothetical protein